jgi:competence protein ComEC
MRKPFVLIFFLLGIGILIGEYVQIKFFVTFLGYVLFLSLSLILIRKAKTSFTFLGISFIFLGMLCIQNTKALSPRHISYSLKFCREEPVMLEGVIVSAIQEKQFFRTQKYMFTLEVKRLKINQGWRFKTGKVLVTAFGDRDLHYGDYVQMEGKLYPPFDFSKDEKFSYKEYLRQKGILAMMSVKSASPMIILASGQGNFFEQVAFTFKKKLKNIFYSILTENEAALMEGMLLGDRSHIPRQINDIFVQTGTAHILAISGMNVGIVAFMIFLLLKMFPIGRRCRLILTIVILIFHAVLTGAQPPVVRATVMACVFFLGILLEREADTMNSLAFAGVVMLIFNPQNLFSVGFQLSFMCVFAIFYFYPIMRNVTESIFPKPDLPRIAEIVLELILFSLAAWIGTIGMIAYYFHMVTPVTILANLVVVPILTPIVIFGTGLLLCGVFWPQIAFLFALSIKVTLNIMVGFILLMSKIPYSSIKIESFSLLQAYLYYAIVLILFFALGRFAKPTTSR